MKIQLKELFSRVDLSDASFSTNRVDHLLADLSEMLRQDEPEISYHELSTLKEHLRIYLKGTSAKAATIRNKVYRLSQLLKLAADQGLVPRHDGIPMPPRPKNNGPARRRYNALRLFDEWLREKHLSASEVTEETFREYRDEMKNRGTSCAEDQYNCAVKSWYELAKTKAVHALEPPRWNDNSQEDYGLPIDKWPTLIRTDFERFCRAATGQAKPGEKRRRLLRPDSIHDVQRELCRLLGYLINIRGDAIGDAGLSEILENGDLVIGFIPWHIAQRCNGRERKHHGETLNWYARLLDWFDGDKEIVNRYRLTAKSLKPERAKDPFPERPITYDEFTSAAQRALEKAEQNWKALGPDKQRSKYVISAAIAYRDALLFAFLTCRPMRSRNIREMEIGQNLYKSGNVWQLRFSEEEMKAGDYHCQFPQVLVDHLEMFLGEIRPFLANGSPCKELFLTKSGKPIGRPDFWKIMTKAGCRIMNLKTNPHLFRYLIPSAYLLRYPDRALEMQALLGHSVLETTLRYYVHVYSRVASQRAAKVIRQNCPAMVELGQLIPPSIPS